MTGSLAQFLPANLFAVMLAFCRIGSALMVLPGFGDLYVPMRYRLLLGIFLATIIATALGPLLPNQPGSPLGPGTRTRARSNRVPAPMTEARLGRQLHMAEATRAGCEAGAAAAAEVAGRGSPTGRARERDGIGHPEKRKR